MTATGTPVGRGTPAGAQAVLDFWFGTEAVARPEWFRKREAFDREIEQRFGLALTAALERSDAVAQAAASHGQEGATAAAAVPFDAASPLAGWRNTPRARLAMLLVCDQFPRNVHRGSARAFAGDALGRTLAREFIDRADDTVLPWFWRAFVYLPLEHSESLADQDESVRLYSSLVAQAAASASAATLGSLEGMLDYARRHHAVVAHFGRFPHRNTSLGRESTEAEQAFLQQPGSSF